MEKRKGLSNHDKITPIQNPVIMGPNLVYEDKFQDFSLTIFL